VGLNPTPPFQAQRGPDREGTSRGSAPTSWVMPRASIVAI